MSRYTLGQVEFNKGIWDDIYDNLGGYRIAIQLPRMGRFEMVYGFDHATGYFVQFFPLNDTAIGETIFIKGRSDEECIDLDSMFSGLTGIDLGYILKVFNGNPTHIDSASMDWPI